MTCPIRFSDVPFRFLVASIPLSADVVDIDFGNNLVVVEDGLGKATLSVPGAKDIYTTFSNSAVVLKINPPPSWSALAKVPFKGDLGIPKELKIVASVSGSDPTSILYFRVMDITNSLVIAEITVTDPGSAYTIFTTTSFTNMPATSAVFEFQKKNAGTGSLVVASAAILF